jgi:transcriptional regulator GlxA family with amidase domain
MKLGYIIFDGITWLDLIGIYDPLSRLKIYNYIPELEWDFCAYSLPVKDSLGLEFVPTQIKNDLSKYDAIIVPGGKGTRTHMHDNGFMAWLQLSVGVEYKISICSGSLLLGAAGFLRGKKATTHFGEYDILKSYCGEVSTERIVEDGNIITAGAVSSSLDLGLYLCRKWSGDEAASFIRRKMDYKG